MRQAGHRAHTLPELLVGITLVVVLTTLLFLVPSRLAKKRERIQCVEHLRTLALVASSEPPFQAISKSPAGTNLLAIRPAQFFTNIWSHIARTDRLHCPADEERKPVSRTTLLTDSNVSYFVNLSPPWAPNGFLFGDRNLAQNGEAISGKVFPISSNEVLSWSRKMHGNAGHIALGDGSVQYFTSLRLQTALTTMGATTNLLLVP